MAETQTQESRQKAFRASMGRFATGVTVITTVDRGGPAGMTASAVTSLSLEPLQLLACVATNLPTHESLTRAGRFVVNVLGEGQGTLAMHFATPSEDKFARVDLRDDQSLPVLRDAIAYFVCQTTARYPGGDHSIFVGEVQEFDHDPDARPLLYWAGRFGTLATAEQQLLSNWMDGIDLW